LHLFDGESVEIRRVAHEPTRRECVGDFGTKATHIHRRPCGPVLDAPHELRAAREVRAYRIGLALSLRERAVATRAGVRKHIWAFRARARGRHYFDNLRNDFARARESDTIAEL